jgi:DNA-binding PadR family transcriptional regulator
MDNKLSKEFFKVFVLRALAKYGIMHGYGFIDLLRERYGFAPSPGMVYPVLKELVRKGFVDVVEGETGSRRQVFYRITPLGKKFLEDRKKLVEDALRHDRRLLVARRVGLIDLALVLKEIFESLDRMGEDEIIELSRRVEECRKSLALLKG